MRSRNAFVCCILIIGMLSACSGSATESAPATDQPSAEQTTAEEAPAESTDASEAESTEGAVQEATVDATKPFFALPAGAAKIDVDPVTQKELIFKNDDMSLNFYGGADLEAALIDVKAQLTAAGYTITKEDTSKPSVVNFTAKSPAGSWGGSCVYVMSKAPEGNQRIPKATQKYWA